jgi:hypothetical protein
MVCTAGPVAAIRQPVGPAHYQVGAVTLSDGTTFEAWGDDNGSAFMKPLRRGDRLEICFGPTRRWADEPANARPAFVVLVRTGDTYTTVGVPGRSAVAFPPAPARRRPLAP